MAEREDAGATITGNESDAERKAKLDKDVAKIRQDAVQTYDRVRDAARVAWMAAFDGSSPARVIDGENQHLVRDHQRRLKKRQERDARKAIETEMALKAATPRRQIFHERTIGDDDFLHLDYFIRGLVAARAVGRIDALFGLYQGTGFLCAPGFIMTNNHVVASAEDARGTEIGFEKYSGRSIRPETFTCPLDPDVFFWTSPKSELDVTIVALSVADGGEDISYELGWHRLLQEEGKIVLGDPTSIIQYPSGARKRIVVHNSSLVYLENRNRGEQADETLDRFLWYTSDTEPGSSGSPVFNKHWEIVALHHAAIPKTNENGEFVDDRGRVLSEEELEKTPSKAVWVANQGVRASRIVKALETADFSNEGSSLRDQYEAKRNFILEGWKARDGQEDVLMKTRRLIAEVQALEQGDGSGPSAPLAAAGGPLFAESAAARSGTALEEEVRRQMRMGGITINIGR